MLFHASIPARDPEHVATVLAEVWRGRVLPFTAAPGTFVVTAGEGPEIHIEVTPAARTTLPPDQPGAVKLGGLDPLVGTHVRLGVPREEADLHCIARAAGWRSRRRGGRAPSAWSSCGSRTGSCSRRSPPPCRPSTGPRSTAAWRRAGSSRCAADEHNINYKLNASPAFAMLCFLGTTVMVDRCARARWEPTPGS